MNKTRLIIVKGFSGSGKSTSIELFLKYCISKKMNVRRVDYLDTGVQVGYAIDDLKLFIFGKVRPSYNRFQGGDAVSHTFEKGPSGLANNVRTFMKEWHDKGYDILAEGYIFTHISFETLDIPTEEIVQYAHLFWYEKYETVEKRLYGRTSAHQVGLKNADFGKQKLETMKKYYAKSRYFSRVWTYKVETANIWDFGMWMLKCYKIEDPNYPTFCQQQFKYLKTHKEVDEANAKSSGSTQVVEPTSKTGDAGKIGISSVEKKESFSKNGDFHGQTNIFQVIGGGEKYGF